ncbi:MAG: ATP-binding protein [Clostridiales bacterium]|nr:ATP-binding protein [Clostridiales bacterium]
MLFIGLVLGALIAGLAVYNIFWMSFYKKKRNLKFLNAANGVSNSVMNIVQMGVVAFTEKGMLLFNNKTCLKKLRVEELPQSFTEFVEKFVTDKDIPMQLKLYEADLPEQRPQETEDELAENEKLESVTTRVEIRNRIIQFHFSKPFFPQSSLRGWVVVLEDVTKAARQEQQRRLFVSTVSHELKTPLASITGYSESLIDWGLREKSPDQIFSDVMKINEEGHRITEIISNLTYLSQIENNKEKIDMTVYRIDKTVEGVCRKYFEDAEKKNIRLYYESLTRAMPPVFGSKSMMEQMVGNLINNALKYSAEHTNIWVYIQAHENTVTIKVQDQGKGIPKPAAEKVFQAFFRVDETGARSAGGSGLGLAIVKMMAEVQEGEVSLVTRCPEDDDSQRSEVGSDFYITVPTAAATFRETLESIKDDADREEVLYRKAKQYVEKINNDDYDLGFDLKSINKEDEELLISHLIFIDECDMIDEGLAVSSAEPAEIVPDAEEEPQTEEILPEPVAQEEVAPEEPEVPQQPVIRPLPQVPQVTPVQEAPQEARILNPFVKKVKKVPETEGVEVLDLREPQQEEVVREEPMITETPVIQPLPQVPEQATVPAVMQPAASEEPNEWVPLTRRGATVLTPDPPALKKPILSKEQIGSSNAEKRRQAKKNTAKKASETEDAKKNAAVSQPVQVPSAYTPAAPATRSLLRQMTDPIQGRTADANAGTPDKQD